MTSRAEPRQRYTRIVATWLVVRVVALASIALTPRLTDDVDIFRGWLPYLRWAQFPMADPKWQYPPGAAIAFLAPDRLHLNYAVSFALMCLVLDAVIMAMLLVAHARRPGGSRNALWLWAGAALIVGPIMYTRFDIVPAFFAVGFVLLARHPLAAGASAALGFVTKVWPIVLMIALPRRSWPKGAVGFITVMVASVGLLAVWFDGIFSFLGNQRARGLQVESTGALPYELMALFRGTRLTTGLEYGSFQVLMPGAETVASAVFFAGIALTLLIAWWRLRGRLDAAPVGDIALTLVLVFVITNRVYSPQYNLWLVAVAAAALLSRRSAMHRVTALIVAASVLTQVIYPWFPFDLNDGNPPVVAVQCLRILTLLVATVLAFRAILAPRTAEADILGGTAVLDRTPDSEESWTSYQGSQSRSASP